MKIILLISIFGFTGMAFAGGQMGGGSPPALTENNSLAVGDIVIDLPVADKDSGFVLDENKMLDVIGATMRKDPITLNGEGFTADRYEFEKGQMLLRSTVKPSKTVILKRETLQPEVIAE